MGLAAKKHIDKYTYKDYESWDDNHRWEIIDGDAYDMSPGPGTTHQLIVTELIHQIRTQLEGRRCNVLTAPFDVRIPREGQSEMEIENVVQPDISIVCDPGKLDEKGCLGAPDVVIEVLSPSSYRKDRLEKFNLYEEAGVKEYWLISPAEKIVEVFQLTEQGKYGRPEIYGDSITVRLNAVENIAIDLNKMFDTRIGSTGPST